MLEYQKVDVYKVNKKCPSCHKGTLVSDSDEGCNPLTGYFPMICDTCGMKFYSKTLYPHTEYKDNGGTFLVDDEDKDIIIKKITE
jgi:hypothetical protein